ncbi:hypothetical protein ACI6PS_02565 [Flavobacterium sp. PLA-1-15]|uniref:hypothetical protein n=1 Tax=Flavobacterium sp. PLA-1-15 TaxID=3380533 RepID=UPI003B7D7C12
MNTKNTIQKEEKTQKNESLHIVAKEQKPTEVVQKSPEVKKEEVFKMIEGFKPEPLTAEERIQRIPLFEELSKRFKHLKEKSNDLKLFKAGNDKTNAKITFQNSQGFNFEIKNSHVIERLTKEAQEELDILLAEANAEILAFEM